MDKKDLSCAFFEDIISPSYRAGVARAVIPRIFVSLPCLTKASPHYLFATNGHLKRKSGQCVPQVDRNRRQSRTIYKEKMDEGKYRERKVE